jgi:hypothetical protein
MMFLQFGCDDATAVLGAHGDVIQPARVRLPLTGADFRAPDT